MNVSYLAMALLPLVAAAAPRPAAPAYDAEAMAKALPHADASSSSLTWTVVASDADLGAYEFNPSKYGFMILIR